MGTPNAVVTMGRTIATTTLTAAQLQQLAAARGQVRSENPVNNYTVLTNATTMLTAAQLQQLAAARGQVRSKTQFIIIPC